MQSQQSSVARGSEDIGGEKFGSRFHGSIKTERQNGDFRNLDGLKKKSCRTIIRKEEVRWNS